ncbi:SMI1/KNR4 family protein [Limibacter armeniacum]|uniref:SMI1/KNR4 family protein n=1 Tax=Limibacter armeniacum TaxID=466084 RepID=UPI002FE6743C
MEKVEKLFLTFILGMESRSAIFNEGEQLEKIISLDILKSYRLPDEFKQLYTVRNGLKNYPEAQQIDPPLENLGYFLSIEFADSVYQKLKSEEKIPKHLYPIFDFTGNGDYLLIALDQHQDDYGMVYMYSPSQPQLASTNHLVTAYDSIESMLDTLEELIDKELSLSYLITGSVDDFRAKMLAEREVCKNRNPKSKYWQL